MYCNNSEFRKIQLGDARLKPIRWLGGIEGADENSSTPNGEVRVLCISFTRMAHLFDDCCGTALSQRQKEF